MYEFQVDISLEMINVFFISVKLDGKMNEKNRRIFLTNHSIELGLFILIKKYTYLLTKEVPKDSTVASSSMVVMRCQNN